MTRKDYVAIAAIIYQRFTYAMVQKKIATTATQDDQWTCRASEVDAIAEDMANMLAQDNPRFDRARFLKACGVQS